LVSPSDEGGDGKDREVIQVAAIVLMSDLVDQGPFHTFVLNPVDLTQPVAHLTSAVVEAIPPELAPLKKLEAAARSHFILLLAKIILGGEALKDMLHPLILNVPPRR
jgi:hypothetical protein